MSLRIHCNSLSPEWMRARWKERKKKSSEKYAVAAAASVCFCRMNEKASWKRRRSIDIYSLFWASIHTTYISNDGVFLLLLHFPFYFGKWHTCGRRHCRTIYTRFIASTDSNKSRALVHDTQWKRIAFIKRNWIETAASVAVGSQQPLSSTAVHICCVTETSEIRMRTRMLSTLAGFNIGEHTHSRHTEW